jgi:Spy/CpxP family protein refolding chaperone
MGLIRVIAWLAVLLPGSLYAQQHQHQHKNVSPYAGERTREIKSLSGEEIADLRKGAGGGFAKAAELNGVPGPSHLLELKDEIQLGPQQTAAIQKLFDRMRTDAVAEGARFVAHERALDIEFKSRQITEETLSEMITKIEESRRKLRYIHLSAHLKTRAILTADQIDRYNALRGYAPRKQ